ncbi:MAG: peptidylprolyl isomerase [Pseudoflavonifractor sp.]
MSASRERKQRQSAGAGLTQKELKEFKEAQDAKRKALIYSVMGIVIAAAIAALLVWNSGFFQSRATSATVGEHTLTVADMQYYYAMAKNEELYNIQYMQSMYQQFGMTYTSPYDNAKADSEQMKDEAAGQTYQAYFQEQALKKATSVTALLGAATAEDYSLSAEGKEQVDSTMKDMKKSATGYGYPNLKSFLQQNYGSYLSEGTYRRHLTETVLADEYARHHQDSLTYTEDQLNAYEKENPGQLTTYDFRSILISGTPEAKKDADGKAIEATEAETAAAAAAAKAKADALVADVKSAPGDKAKAFDALAVESVPGTDAATLSQTGKLGQNLAGNAYFDWLSDAARKPGDVTAIESSGSYYVVLFEEGYLNDAATTDVRHILVKAELTPDDPATADKNEAATEPTDAQMEAAKVKAQELLDKWTAGEKTEDAFAALAKENSEDGGSASNGGLYRYVEKDSMVPTFNDWIFDAARKPGDTGLVENKNANQYGWHVMYYVGSNGPKWHELAETALKTADMTTWTETNEKPYAAAWVDKAHMGK